MSATTEDVEVEVAVDHGPAIWRRMETAFGTRDWGAFYASAEELRRDAYDRGVEGLVYAPLHVAPKPSVAPQVDVGSEMEAWPVVETAAAGLNFKGKVVFVVTMPDKKTIVAVCPDRAWADRVAHAIATTQPGQ